jgi:hypothetical protein
VVDAEDHELARITPRRFVMDLGPEDTRARLARWGREAHSLFIYQPPRSCEVVEAGPGFDWRRHGLFVALAAFCDTGTDRLPSGTRGG